MWRRESNRQREIALKLAKEYQVIAKARRANDHDEGLARRKGEPSHERDDQVILKKQVDKT